MKILKMKSILFSIVAVTLISAFLTSCEKDFVQTDVPAQALDVADQKEDQNEVTDLESFQNMKFSGVSAPVFGSDLIKDDLNAIVELNGELLVSDRGNVSGKVLVASANKAVNGVVSFDNQVVSYSRDGKTVKFNPINGESLVVVSGIDKKEVTLNTLDVIDNLVENKSQKVETLSIEQQALSAYFAIFNSSPWIANLNYATGSSYYKMSCSWWQYGAIYATTATIITMGLAGCAYTIGAICTKANIITIGALTLPCSFALMVCAIGVRTGALSVQAALINHFCNK